MTRLDDLLDFGQLLKPFATINLPKSPTFFGNFCKGVKINHFSSEIFFGNFYCHLAIFFWSHCPISITAFTTLIKQRCRHSSVYSSVLFISCCPSLSPMHTIYALIIYSQICAIGICHVKRTKKIKNFVFLKWRLVM